MSPFSSEAAWLCLAVTAALGGLVLCKLNKSPGPVGKKVACLGGLWGGACLLSLPLFWALILFSLSCVLLYIHLSGQEFLPVDQKAVLITGGDTGIGHALSKYLDQLGFTVFAGVLNENGSGAEELRRTCSKRFSVLQLDVTNSQQIKEAYSKVVQKVQNRGLWAVVNNAGILGLPTDGELIPMVHYKRCMDVNFFGAVEVTKAFLPLLRKSKGRLVNISSMGGVVPFFKMAAYGSSKAALAMFSAVMRQELSKWGVKVSTIQPGGFKTNIAGTSELRNKLEKDILDHLTPDVQEDYGQEYILAQKNFFNLDHDYSSDLSPVLQDIRHAISAKSPFTFYTPGPGAYLWFCLVSFIPTGIFDYFSKKVNSLNKAMLRIHTVPHWKNKTMKAHE